MIEVDTIIQGDCLEVMRKIESKSIDMVCCDLPYGTTACSWDVIIPFEPLWGQYKRIIKEGGALVLFGSQPFTTDLISSNREWFRYEWVWDKGIGKNFMLAKTMPLKSHENILIFYNSAPTYNPQRTIRKKEQTIARDNRRSGINKSMSEHYNVHILRSSKEEYKYPTTVIYYNSQNKGNQFRRDPARLHPTQKPVGLIEYLIRTYTNENELVLDNCIGSGTTAIACLNAGRHYIGIEKEKKYFDIANERIKHSIIRLL
jgi:DNA modification methylase